jgi:hypothetical protein
MSRNEISGELTTECARALLTMILHQDETEGYVAWGWQCEYVTVQRERHPQMKILRPRYYGKRESGPMVPADKK